MTVETVGQAGGKRRGIGKWLAVVGAGLVVIVAIPIIAISASGTEGGTPACDDPAVTQKVIELTNAQVEAFARQFGNPALGLAGMTHALLNVRQLHVDKDSGFRACVANNRRDNRNGLVGYTVQWHDKQEGTFQINLIDPSALAERYEQKPATEAAKVPPKEEPKAETTPPPAPEPATAPAAELPEAQPASDALKESAAPEPAQATEEKQP